MTPRTVRRAVTLVLLGALALSATACSDDVPSGSGAGAAADVRRAPDRPDASAEPSQRPRVRQRGEAVEPPADAPRTKVVRTPARPRGNALTIRTAGADGHLVTAADLGRRWRERSTGDEGSRTMSPCHAATFHDVGADRVRLREFSGPGRAVQAAARFVDHRSALRIERVVHAWERDCAADLADRGAALGVVRHGRWLAVVEVADLQRPARHLQRALDAAASTF